MTREDTSTIRVHISPTLAAEPLAPCRAETPVLSWRKLLLNAPPARDHGCRASAYSTGARCDLSVEAVTEEVSLPVEIVLGLEVEPELMRIEC